MSFKIGQLLSSNLREGDFFISKPISLPASDKRFRDSITFYTGVALGYDVDKTFQEAYITAENQFEAGKYYYIKVKIERNYSDQEITLKLENNTQTEDSYSQFIDSFKINKKENDEDGKDFIFYQTIFAPNITYSQIRFLLERNVVDFYTSKNPYTGENFSNQQISAWKGRQVVITECQIYQMKNLLKGNKIANSSLIKIGIQGPPGLLMCINGEPIRIGPSGIFEIRNGYKVYFLSFVRGISLQSDGQYGMDNFIIDYQYTIEEQGEENEEGDDVNGDDV